MSSIGPVGSPAFVPEPPGSEKQARPAPKASSASENAPAREAVAEKNAPPVPLAAQDEVRVQWDTPMADYIEIYQFVNQASGSLVLQEPNQEMLSLIHEIRQMLQETAQQAAAASSAPVKAVE